MKLYLLNHEVEVGLLTWGRGGSGDRKMTRENVGFFLGNILHLQRGMGLLPNMLRAEEHPCHPTQQRPCHQPQGSPGSMLHSTGYDCFKAILRPLILFHEGTILV